MIGVCFVVLTVWRTRRTSSKASRGEPLRDYETIVVEHRLFSFISSNWLYRLIATTTTAKGLTVTRRLDRHRYPAGRKMSNDEIASVNLTPHAFHGELNYLIRPRISL